MEKSVQLVIDYLNQLGDKLTPFAKDLFGIYTKQAIADGIGDLIVAVVLIIVTLCGMFIAKRIIQNEDDKDFATMTTLWSGIFVFIFVIIGLRFLIDGVKEIINPTYYAIQKLLEVMK